MSMPPTTSEIEAMDARSADIVAPLAGDHLDDFGLVPLKEVILRTRRVHLCDSRMMSGKNLLGTYSSEVALARAKPASSP
ncbi:MAG TPA: hypothetical protein VGO33_12905 [Gemmatimonadaceae bacterium]|jgi:hypothetical protein|nr:hypothetical protein [Gemmatimonadaceae bacterium]